MNYLVSILIAAITSLGFSYFTPVKIWDDVRNFGSTNFPTSLDSLTNPSATDNVATVSHSSQHSNANDAIEAIEAKTGITASTPIANSILVGNGTGSSIWATYATSTQFYATNFFATGSSTLQNFSGVNATTSTFFSSLLTSNTASSTSFLGAGLSTCSASDKALTWSGGQFGCNTFASSEIYLDATTTIGVTTAIITATTTYASTNEKLMIWANCVVDNDITLNVKGAAATTTIGKAFYGGTGATNFGESVFGLYTAVANEAIEIYVGKTNADLNYESCQWPTIMFIKS